MTHTDSDGAKDEQPTAPLMGEATDKTAPPEGGEDPSVLRAKMKQYWGTYDANLKSMMLSEDAASLAPSEQQEVLGCLPAHLLRGSRVLELGAGIGRFTVVLAETAASVTAVDFMESYTQENRRTNGHRANVSILCQDVTKMEQAPSSLDVVFSNWLFMYLSDEESQRLLQKVLTWLKPDGHLFFRESCFHQSGNLRRPGENPTRYRSLTAYDSMLRACAGSHTYTVLRARSIDAYIQMKNNPNQVCFLVRKIPKPEIRTSTPTDLSLFTSAIPEDSIVVEELLKRKVAVANRRVLDACYGLGGLSSLVTAMGCSYLHGRCASVPILNEALKRQELFQHEDLAKMSYEMTDFLEVIQEKYDVICNSLPLKGVSGADLAWVKGALSSGGRCLLLLETGSTPVSLRRLATESGLSDVTVTSWSKEAATHLQTRANKLQKDSDWAATLTELARNLRSCRSTWVILEGRA